MEINNYELMLVANVDRADQLLSRVEKSIKEANGSSVNVERLGKKTLAYTIKKQTDAAYFVISFKAEGSAIKPVWDKLKLEQEDLLRYLFLKKKDKKSKSKKGRMVSPIFTEASRGKEVSQEDKEKPKVTVAVKKASKVKSKKEEVAGESKVSKVKGSKMKSKKSTKGKKGKTKK